MGIGGTRWKPGIPSEKETVKEIQNAMQSSTDTDKALGVLCYLMRNQTFFDGNKRTAMLAANHILIGSGRGILTIPIELQGEFKTKLLSFYESAQSDELEAFLYGKCLFGQDRVEEAEEDFPFSGIQWNEPGEENN